MHTSSFMVSLSSESSVVLLQAGLPGLSSLDQILVLMRIAELSSCPKQAAIRRREALVLAKRLEHRVMTAWIESVRALKHEMRLPAGRLKDHGRTLQAHEHPFSGVVEDHLKRSAQQRDQDRQHDISEQRRKQRLKAERYDTDWLERLSPVSPEQELDREIEAIVAAVKSPRKRCQRKLTPAGQRRQLERWGY